MYVDVVKNKHSQEGEENDAITMTAGNSDRTKAMRTAEGRGASQNPHGERENEQGSTERRRNEHPDETRST